MQIDGIVLMDQFVWENEFSWSRIGQTQDRSVTGAFLVQEQAKTYGREIDLIGGEDTVWATRGTIKALKAKENLLEYDFPVILSDGQTFQCMFNRSGGPAIQVSQVARWEDPALDATYYAILKIRLITVEP